MQGDAAVAWEDGAAVSDIPNNPVMENVCGVENHRENLDHLHFFFSSRRRHTRFDCDWSSDVCSSDLDGDGFYYRGNLYYDLTKVNAIRLAMDFANELRKKKIACVAVTPGFLRSEAVLEKIGRASCRERV